jgi:hypothetical protein
MITLRGERVLWHSPKRRAPVLTWADPTTLRIRLIDAKGVALIDSSWPVFMAQVRKGWIELTGEVDENIPTFHFENLLSAS